MKASKALSKCLPAQLTDITGTQNEFYFGIKELDGVDAWKTYVKGHSLLNKQEAAALNKDIFLGRMPLFGSLINHKPGVRSSIKDIDVNAYYISKNADGTVELGENGRAVYRRHKDGSIVDFSKIGNKKEKFLYIFNRDQKRMIAAPIWRNKVKHSTEMYVSYLRSDFPNLMTDVGFDRLEKSIYRFFEDIEAGKGKQGWFDVIYNLFGTSLGNHWYLISKVMPSTFDRMMSDRQVAENLLGYNFKEVSFTDFNEAASAYASKARGGNLTVVDLLGEKGAGEVYGLMSRKLFDFDENGKVIRLDDNEIIGRPESVLNKSYFMKLSVEQQLEQLKFTLGEDSVNINKFWSKARIKSYSTGAVILKGINFIGKPWVYSLLMTFGKGMAGFMPLLILNSGMFVTDALAGGYKLGGNRKGFFQKWNLGDGLPKTFGGFSESMGETLTDAGIRFINFAQSLAEQGLFNGVDLLMENSYKVRAYQNFFQSQFPGIKSVSDIDRILTTMAEYEPDALMRLLDAARGHAEYSVRLSTTNSSSLGSLLRIHPANKRWNQTWKDIWYTMFNFFSGWGFNKIIGCWDSLKTGRDNVYHGRIGSKYLDDLIGSIDQKTGMKLSREEINARMTKAYLENEQYIYTLNKIYTGFIVSKYLDRLTESSSEKNSNTVFDDLGDMLDFMEVFSGEYAALSANPQGRIVKTFLEMFIGEVENGQNIGVASTAAVLSSAKEFRRSFFRKLYLPQMATEYFSLTVKNRDTEEIFSLERLKKSVTDNANAYLFYLKDQTENGEFDFRVPRGPNSYLRDVLQMGNNEAQYIQKQITLGKYANMIGSDKTGKLFLNWIAYSFPFLKQWYLNQLDSTEGFLDDFEVFRSSQGYQSIINSDMPSDVTDEDYRYLYDIITRRLLNDEYKINDQTLKGSYVFFTTDEKTGELKVGYDKNRQTQENIIHYLMQSGLSDSEAKGLINMLEDGSDKYKLEAARTLAYMEAKTPGSSLQALAYIMNREALNYVYRSGTYYDDTEESELLKKQMREKGKIKAARKYSDYLLRVDRYYITPQYMLYYAKTRGFDVGRFIDGPGDSGSRSMKLTTQNANDEDFVYQNKQLLQNFEAQLMVDVEASNGNPDAYKLMNGYSLIFDVKKYEMDNGSIDPINAARILNQLEAVYDHISGLAMDENSQRVIKQGTLMFGDRLFESIMKDEELMQREDVQTVVKDWITYRYGEFRELDNIAIEYAEDQLYNNEMKRYGSKRNYLNGGKNRKFYGFDNRYDYMKNKAYSKNYIKYRVFDWIPRTGGKQYLTEYQFDLAKYGMGGWTKFEKKSKGLGSKQKDNGPGGTTKRGKSIQFYKREDIDKPVEYKTPRRKRLVRKGSGVKPI